MIREAKRKDLDYKRSAIAELEKYLLTFPSIHLFEQVKEVIENDLTDLSEEDDTDLQMKPMFVLRDISLTIAVLFYKRICTLLPLQPSTRSPIPI
jgi:hypothetical protein